jgi:hypothetical protein
VVVRGHSAAGEAAAVTRVGLQILFWWALLLCFERGNPRAGAAADAALAAAVPGTVQIRFADLASRDQRLFRQIQEGIAEAERVRVSTGKWPSVEALAEQGIPPFAPDPIDRAHYGWSLLQKGVEVNYVGAPAAGLERESFVVLILEPDPGTPIDPKARPDEIHHPLPDGSMLHVSIWMGPPLRGLTDPVESLPPEKGWKQVLVGQAL